MTLNIEYLKKKVKKINPNTLVTCSFADLKQGDIVSSFTMTFSQKYFFKIGYEGYNMFKYGILINKNNEFPEESVLLQYDNNSGDFIETNLYSNPGSSGSYAFAKKIVKKCKRTLKNKKNKKAKKENK
jgi:hypothetical protein